MAGDAALAQQGEAEESQLALPAGEVYFRKTNSSPPQYLWGGYREAGARLCTAVCTGMMKHNRHKEKFGLDARMRTVKQAAQTACVDKDIHRGFENLSG